MWDASADHHTAADDACASRCAFLRCRPLDVGASALLLALPFLTTRDPWWLVQGAASLMSDYVHAGRRSVWHPIDRAVARAGLAYAVACSWRRHGLFATALALAVPLLCYARSARAIARRDECAYRRWHTRRRVMLAKTVTRSWPLHAPPTPFPACAPSPLPR